MLGTRLVYLLLAFILSFAASQPVEWLLANVADLMPGGAAGFLYLVIALAGSAAQFFAAGVLFALLSGLSWRRAALWAVLGTAVLNLLCAGPGALSRAYFAVQLGSLVGAARALIAVAAGAYGCWFLEQREHAQWVEQGRAMILSLLGQ